MPTDNKISDPETLKMLDQVKKGKPRKFVMICKGQTIVSIVLFKKGSVEKYRKQAKSEGSGQFYHGVVEGKGANLNFKLAREDGYDKQPTKTQLLKKYLNDSQDFKFKPMFEIVDSAPLALDDEDPLVGRFQALQPQAMQVAESSPQLAADINSLCLQIGNLLDQDQADQASQSIARLEDLLKQAAGASPTATPEPATEQDPQDAQVDPNLVDRLKQLLRQAQPLANLLGSALKERVEAIQQTLHGPQPQGAEASLNELEEWLNVANTYQTRLLAVEPQLLEVLKSNPADGTKLRAVFEFATGKASEYKFQDALVALERLEPALARAKDGPKDTDTIAEGTVDLVRQSLQKSGTAWGKTRKAIEAELETLRTAILQACQDEYDFREIAQNSQLMFSMLDELDESLIEELKEAAQADSVEVQSQHRQNALQIIERYMDFVAKDPFINAVDSNPFKTVKVKKTLDVTLVALKRNLEKEAATSN